MIYLKYGLQLFFSRGIFEEKKINSTLPPHRKKNFLFAVYQLLPNFKTNSTLM
jgi:hypothetical protein